MGTRARNELKLMIKANDEIHHAPVGYDPLLYGRKELLIFR